MTAASHARRRMMRLSSMESLGFIDPPTESWTSPQTPSPAELTIQSDPIQTTELVNLPVGRHSRHAQPTGELVKDIWDSTELNAPSLLDWAPDTFNPKTLAQRRFRWPIVTLVIIGFAVAAGLGYWLYRLPSDNEASALADVEAQADVLLATLDRVAPLVADLDADRLPDANQDSTVYLELGEVARALFSASARLPASDTAERSAAADAASLILDASRQSADATAFRTALEAALTLPLLETDPGLTDLTTATAAFSEWRNGFEIVRDALPSEVTGHASEELDEITAGLDAVQANYLDALRSGDRHAAVEAIGGLKAGLTSVRQALLLDMETISTGVSRLYEQAAARLDQLLG